MTDNMSMIAGKNGVLEALKAKQQVNKIFLTNGISSPSLEDILNLAREQKIPVKRVQRQKLDEMCPTTKHQGIIATVPPKEYTDFFHLIEHSLAVTANPVLVLLDEIQDPGNMGAIIRSVEGLGAQGLIIPKHRAVPLTEGVNKAAAGTLSYVPVARVTNLVKSIEQLKQKSFWVVGTDPKAIKTAFEVKLNGPLAVVIGGENKGLGRLVKESCDYLVRLPMQGSINSLNASVAAGIVLYEILRQRLTR